MEVDEDIQDEDAQEFKHCIPLLNFVLTGMSAELVPKLDKFELMSPVTEWEWSDSATSKDGDVVMKDTEDWKDWNENDTSTFYKVKKIHMFA